MAKEKRGRKYYALRSKRGVGGIVATKPRRRKQDRRFVPSGDLFAVVFFPKLTGIGKAQVYKHTLVETLSCTRATAIAKFMDHGTGRRDHSDIWRNYQRAGWKVRRVRITDLGG